jgi:hypothetical protein
MPPETDPIYAAAVAELAAIKAKLARMEAIARQAPPGLDSAIAEHVGRPASPDVARARLEAIARGFVPDPQSEAALVARAKDPAGYDAEMRRVGAFDGLGLALYSRGRAAAVKLGTFDPNATTEE